MNSAPFVRWLQAKREGIELWIKIAPGKNILMREENDILHYQRIEDAYDGIAPEYARSNAEMPPEIIERGIRFLAYLALGARILDVGCGAGRDMAWMEERGFSVTGIDLSTGMLAQARTHVKGELLQMEMSALTFPAASFEGIWCNASLLHVPKVQVPTVLRQMRRVLVPEGMLYLGIQEGSGEGWEVTRFGVERFFARYALDEIEALLSQAGFSLLEYERNEAGSRHWLTFMVKAV